LILFEQDFRIEVGVLREIDFLLKILQTDSLLSPLLRLVTQYL